MPANGVSISLSRGKFSENFSNRKQVTDYKK
jgi:hypothetical protein